VGTEFQLAGLAAGQCAQSWNLECSDHVERVGRAYVGAGGQVILMNSLGANRAQLAHRGFGSAVAR
jgi:methionine synthase I (cobalamin-dependent)